MARKPPVDESKPFVGARLVKIETDARQGIQTWMRLTFDNGAALDLASCTCCDGISATPSIFDDDDAARDKLHPWHGD